MIVDIIAPNNVSNEERKDWLQNIWKEIRREKLKEILEGKAPIEELGSRHDTSAYGCGVQI